MNWLLWLLAFVSLGVPVGSLTIDRIFGIPARFLGNSSILRLVPIPNAFCTTGTPADFATLFPPGKMMAAPS